MLSDYGLAPVFKEVSTGMGPSVRGSGENPTGPKDINSSYDQNSHLANPAGMLLNTV
jgi:hypothetical protein